MTSSFPFIIQYLPTVGFVVQHDFINDDYKLQMNLKCATGACEHILRHGNGLRYNVQIATIYRRI